MTAFNDMDMLINSFLEGCRTDMKPPAFPYKAGMEEMMGRAETEYEVENAAWGAAKSWFSEHFLTEKIMKDAPLLIRDIMANCAEKFMEYAGRQTDTDEYCIGRLPVYHQITLCRVLVDMAFDGERYAKDLLISLYKNNYKKEYRCLKRFTVFDCVSDAKTLMDGNENENEDENEESRYLLSRAIIMARLLDIRLVNENVLLGYLSKRRKEEIKNDESERGSDIRGISVDALKRYTNCVKHIVKKKDLPRALSQLSMYLSLAEVVMHDFTFYDVFSYEDTKEIFYEYSIYALSFFDAPESVSLEWLSAMTACAFIAYNYGNYMDKVYMEKEIALGFGEEYYSKAVSRNFSPVIKRPGRKLNMLQTKGPEPEKETSDDDKDGQEAEALKRRITDLEEALRNKNRELKDLKGLYAKEKETGKDLRTKAKKADDYKAELESLRNFVFSLSSDETDVPEDTSEETEKMREYISGKRIVIVGGNQNWRKKLSDMFPDWIFIYTHNRNVRCIKNADHVFFFTDSISHSLYNKYRTAAKNMSVPYSFIHGVELNRNIRLIYDSLL